jgi:hypothetical protein
MKPVCPNCKVEGKIMAVTTEKHFHFITHIESDGLYEVEMSGIDKYNMVVDEEFICDSCNRRCDLEEMSSTSVSLVQ